MSTSSNKSSKRGEEGMGKAGKRYQMVTDIYIYERLACERVVCMSDGVYVCMCALCSHTQNMPHAIKSGERHEVRGVRDSVSKGAGADHGKEWSATGVWRKQMVVYVCMHVCTHACMYVCMY